MIKYVLTSKEARDTVDLRGHRYAIDGAACDIIHNMNVALEFGCDFFIVQTDFPVTEEEICLIDQKLAYSELGKYKIEGQPLFTAIECDGQDLGPDTVKMDKYTRFLEQMKELKAQNRRNKKTR